MPKNLEMWISLLGSAGVIAGLVLVSLQLNQSSELLRLQMLDQESLRFANQELALIGEDGARVWQKVLQQPDELSISEQRVAESILWPAYEAWRNSYKLHEEGLLGEEWMSRVISQAPYYLGHTYGRAWWENFKDLATGPDELPPELSDFIDEQLAESGNLHVEYHRGVMDRVRNELEENNR